MKVRFSRHSKRRMRLYNIPESIVIEIISQEIIFEKGLKELIKNVEGFKYPIKVVFVVENDYILVVTVYPLRSRGI